MRSYYDEAHLRGALKDCMYALQEANIGVTRHQIVVMTMYGMDEVGSGIYESLFGCLNTMLKEAHFLVTDGVIPYKLVDVES